MREDLKRMETLLSDVPTGRVVTVSSDGKTSVTTKGDSADRSRTERDMDVRAISDGKGRISVSEPYPGIRIQHACYLANHIRFSHADHDDVLKVTYCRSGRVGWNLQDGTTVYLGRGDLEAHAMCCCATSEMHFPLGYFEGLTFIYDIPLLERELPEILQGTDLHTGTDLRKLLDPEHPTALTSDETVALMMKPLFTTPSELRDAYERLKSVELLLFLKCFDPSKHPAVTRPVFQQTETIKEIHGFLTEHPETRYTIDELSHRFLINTSTLKAVFKQVYGQPIATYMKEFRIRHAMELLRTTEDSIAEIAAQVGYETQGKFTGAFKDVVGVLPSEYRKCPKA